MRVSACSPPSSTKYLVWFFGFRVRDAKALINRESFVSKKRPCLKKLRQVAYYRQNGQCFYCQRPMWLSDMETYASLYRITKKQAFFFQCTGEHLVAHSEGGKASQENIVAACKFCNVKRHDRKRAPSPDDYAQYVQRRLEKGAWNSQMLR